MLVWGLCGMVWVGFWNDLPGFELVDLGFGFTWFGVWGKGFGGRLGLGSG